jgi:NitT/TauT family transport system substrate-binding protein
MKIKMTKKTRLILIMTTILLFTVTAIGGCNKKDNIPNNQNIGETKEETNSDKGLLSDDISDEKEKVDINIAALKGPTGMGMVKLMEDAEKNDTLHNYKFTVAGEADIISTGLVKGEFDIAAVPCNLASVLYNKTEGQIKIAGINTLGVLYIVETGSNINEIEDLRGKTIYSTGYGTTPQYTLNYLLSLYGLDPEKDLTIEYKTEATEVAAVLENSTDAVAMLPQPYVTTVMMNNERVRIAIDIEKEWTAQNQDTGVVTGVVVVNSEFLKNYPEAVRDFLSEYEKSAEFVNNDVDKAAELIEKFGLFKAAVAKKAIPFCNITLIRDSRMKEMVEGYLNVLYEQNPNAVGGALPADDFYYMAEGDSRS